MSKLEYHIVERTTAQALETRVTRLFFDGWRPIGGVSVAAWTTKGKYTSPDLRKTFCQAMIKETPAKPYKEALPA
jgi:hypothetical protein